MLVFGHRKHLERKSGSRSPFVEDLLRLPGHTARLVRLEFFDNLTDKYNQFLLFSVLFVFSSLYVESIFGWISLIIAMIGLGYTLYRAWNLYAEIQTANLRCDGEEYVGQELNSLSADGVYVYHDLPCPGGNIDHIVIGKDKVFVVETFTLNKQSENYAADTKTSLVKFNGKSLKFPQVATTEPINTATKNAIYLKEQLQKNANVNFRVMPVVAIPGWHVQITDKNKAELLVINPKRGLGLKAWLGRMNSPKTHAAVVEYISTVARSLPPRSKKTDSDADQKFDVWFSPRFKDKILKD